MKVVPRADVVLLTVGLFSAGAIAVGDDFGVFETVFGDGVVADAVAAGFVTVMAVALITVLVRAFRTNYRIRKNIESLREEVDGLRRANDARTGGRQ